MSLGVMRGWRLVAMPANGQISNVSAVVLPEPGPMADDDRQIPMFPGDDPARDLLFTVIKLQAEGIRTIAAVNQHLLELEKQRLAKRRNGDSDTDNHVLQPRERELREWHSFRTYFQKREAAYRHDHRMGPDERLTKQMLSSVVGYVPRHITRLMVETHGLLADQWPPSTWPEEAPGDKS
jgi:hypothetical protein